MGFLLGFRVLGYGFLGLLGVGGWVGVAGGWVGVGLFHPSHERPRAERGPGTSQPIHTHACVILPCVGM